METFPNFAQIKDSKTSFQKIINLDNSNFLM